MTKPKAPVQANEARVVRSYVQSTSERFSTALLAIGEEYIEEGGTFSELASIAGDAGALKRQRIAEFIRDTIRGVKNDLSAAAIELAQKLGVIEEATDILAPAGGKVFRTRILVDWSKPWREHALSMCPQTPTDWDILNMGDQFESSQKGQTIEEIIFLWFGPNVNGTALKADAWANEHKLIASHGRIPMAVIGGMPGLIGQLRNMGFPYSSVGIISTSQCKLGRGPHVPNAWQCDGCEREAGLYHVARGWNDYNLFVFESSRK